MQVLKNQIFCFNMIKKILDVSFWTRTLHRNLVFTISEKWKWILCDLIIADLNKKCEQDIIGYFFNSCYYSKKKNRGTINLELVLNEHCYGPNEQVFIFYL